jgi:DNA-directed RNA polymerase beta' subunit
MIPIIWAFGSILVLMLIIAFLPLGFTVKGKSLIVLASFVLALGGQVAVLFVPLWETSLMLAALIFFTTYFMDKRIGTLMFKEIPLYVEELPTEYKNPVLSSKIDKAKNNNSIELAELEIVETSAINMANKSQIIIQPVMQEIKDNENKMQDEDISFLLERNSGNEVEEKKEELKPEIGDFSDIESFLDEKIDGRNDHSETKEIAQLVDSTFDFLFEPKEVSVGHDDFQEEIETKKKLTLQK